MIELDFLNTHPHGITPFGPPPTALSAAQVTYLAELLGQIDMSAILAGLPADSAEAAVVIGHGADKIVGGPREYLLRHFNALREFSLDAARRHLLIVLLVGLTSILTRIGPRRAPGELRDLEPGEIAVVHGLLVRPADPPTGSHRTTPATPSRSS